MWKQIDGEQHGNLKLGDSSKNGRVDTDCIASNGSGRKSNRGSSGGKNKWETPWTLTVVHSSKNGSKKIDGVILISRIIDDVTLMSNGVT